MTWHGYTGIHRDKEKDPTRTKEGTKTIYTRGNR